MHRAMVLAGVMVWSALVSIRCSTRADKELCERTGDHLVEVTVEARLAGASSSEKGVSDEAVREAAIIDAKEARARFITACTSSPRTLVQCIHKAPSLAAVEACQR